MIELKTICKDYRMGGEVLPALQRLDLRIERGEFVAVTGPSGSGKSTLMNVIGCLDRPTSGSYRLCGEETTTASEDALAKIRNRTIGFVFQNFNLLPRLSALDNAALPGLYAGGDSRDYLQRAATLLDRLGLAARKEHRPNELSGGQRQRVAIARALLNDPPLLIADEPTGNLDSQSTRDIMQVIGGLQQSGRTIVLVTHEAEIAAQAGRILEVRDGKLVADRSSGGKERQCIRTVCG